MMMFLQSTFCIILINGFTGIKGSEYGDYDRPVSIEIFHSVNPEPEPHWSERGYITISSNHVTGDTQIRQKSVNASDARSLQTLAKLDGLYRIKSIVRTSSGKEVTLLSYIKACLLLESYLTDELTVSLDYAGSVVAVTLSPKISFCENHSIDADDLREFNTNVRIRPAEVGPVPDTAAYIQKLEREREARERGDVKDNRSFLAKYWMYIVPVVIFVVLSGATNPEAAGGR